MRLFKAPINLRKHQCMNLERFLLDNRDTARETNRVYVLYYLSSALISEPHAMIRASD